MIFNYVNWVSIDHKIKNLIEIPPNLTVQQQKLILY
jgi:hypothetical protein